MSALSPDLALYACDRCHAVYTAWLAVNPRSPADADVPQRYCPRCANLTRERALDRAPTPSLFPPELLTPTKDPAHAR